MSWLSAIATCRSRPAVRLLWSRPGGGRERSVMPGSGLHAGTIALRTLLRTGRRRGATVAMAGTVIAWLWRSTGGTSCRVCDTGLRRRVKAMDLSGMTLFDMARQKMSWLGQRQAVLAQNIANSDTPGYRT